MLNDWLESSPSPHRPDLSPDLKSLDLPVSMTEIWMTSTKIQSAVGPYSRHHLPSTCSGYEINTSVSKVGPISRQYRSKSPGGKYPKKISSLPYGNLPREIRSKVK
jgi:hypothetical protein